MCFFYITHLKTSSPLLFKVPQMLQTGHPHRASFSSHCGGLKGFVTWFWKKLFPGNCSNKHSTDSSVWWCQRSHPFKYSVAALLLSNSCRTVVITASKDDTQEPPEAIAALPGHDWFLEMQTIGIQMKWPKETKKNTPGDFWKYLYNKS